MLFGFVAQSQKQLVWPLLELTTYKIIQDDATNSRFDPSFPTILETNFENQEVLISGYLIPVDVEAQTYALSKNPFSLSAIFSNISEKK